MYRTLSRTMPRPGARLPVALAFFGATLLIALAGARAQSQPPQGPEDQAPSLAAPQQPTIPDEKLNAAAAAMEQVASLRESYQQQINAAPESDKPRIAGEATQALAKAVTDQGLSIDEYNAIIHAAQDNPAVRDGLVQRMHSLGP